MNAMEKFHNAVNLGKVTSKQDIPVFAHMCMYPAVPAGMTQKDIFESNENWMKAMVKAYEVIGTDPDVVFPMCPRDVAFIEQMKVKIPGRELGDNEMFQFIEEEIMTQDDYQKVIDQGYGKFQMPLVASIQTPPVTGPFLIPRMTLKFIQAGIRCGKNRKYWEGQRGIPMMFHTGTAPAFDSFSMFRSMEEFFYDVYDEPELVKKACAAATPDIIKTVFQSAKKGDRVAVFAMRSSATFVSPAMFEEFCWPYLKQMIEAFHQKGITAVIHADADWLPMLPFFQKVPKGSCIIELDGATDIVKAKEILNGYQCIRGDMPANILAFEDEKATQAYCDKLIDLAMDGGFIIGSGCEIPLNAKLDNMRVFLNCCK